MFQVVRSEDGQIVNDCLTRTQADRLVVHLAKSHLVPHHVRVSR